VRGEGVQHPRQPTSGVSGRSRYSSLTEPRPSNARPVRPKTSAPVRFAYGQHRRSERRSRGSAPASACARGPRPSAQEEKNRRHPFAGHDPPGRGGPLAVPVDQADGEAAHVDPRRRAGRPPVRAAVAPGARDQRRAIARAGMAARSGQPRAQVVILLRRMRIAHGASQAAAIAKRPKEKAETAAPLWTSV